MGLTDRSLKSSDSELSIVKHPSYPAKTVGFLLVAVLAMLSDYPWLLIFLGTEGLKLGIDRCWNFKGVFCVDETLIGSG